MVALRKILAILVLAIGVAIVGSSIFALILNVNARVFLSATDDIFLTFAALIFLPVLFAGLIGFPLYFRRPRTAHESGIFGAVFSFVPIFIGCLLGAILLSSNSTVTTLGLDAIINILIMMVLIFTIIMMTGGFLAPVIGAVIGYYIGKKQYFWNLFGLTDPDAIK